MMYQLPFELILFLLALFFGLTIFLLTYLAVGRLIERRNHQKRLDYLSKIKGDWYKYLMEDGAIEPIMIPKNKKEYQFTEFLLIDYLNQLSHEEMLSKISSFANTHLINYYTMLLHKNKFADRMYALLKIHEFRVNGLYDYCLERESRFNSYEERYQLLKIFSLSDHEVFIEQFIKHSQSLTEYDTENLLLTIGYDLYNKLKLHFRKVQRQVQLCYIDTLGNRGSEEDIIFLESLLADEDQEIRIRALKAINGIGVVYDYQKYIPFTTSDSWQERLMVTRVLQYFSIDLTYLPLVKLMQDENFLIRTEACETIRKGEGGLIKLIEFTEQSSDDYAIDAAHEVLSR